MLTSDVIKCLQITTYPNLIKPFNSYLKLYRFKSSDNTSKKKVICRFLHKRKKGENCTP